MFNWYLHAREKWSWQVQTIEFVTKLLSKDTWMIAKLVTEFKYFPLTNCQNESRASETESNKKRETDRQTDRQSRDRERKSIV